MSFGEECDGEGGCLSSNLYHAHSSSEEHADENSDLEKENYNDDEEEGNENAENCGAGEIVPPSAEDIVEGDKKKTRFE